MDELAISPIGNDTVPIRIRCKGPDIDIWVGGGTTSALRARDQGLSTGEIGTFIGGRGVLFSGWGTTVSCSLGPLLILPVNVNMTTKSHSFFPYEERQQHVTSGSWVSDVYQLDGARDAIFSMDISVPFGTKYTAQLLNAAGDHVIHSDVRDGAQVPEEMMAGSFKLKVQLETEDDAVTPELRGWGIGYRAMLNPLSDRGPSEKEDVYIRGDTISLMPSRDLWIKDDLPTIKPGNIPEDASGVTIGSIVPYGDSWRVYYTGRSATGVQTICVAISTDGESFTEFIPIFSGDSMYMAWDSIRRDPMVLFLGDVWLMYYIGELYVGQVGLALSGNGFDWTPLAQPILRPSSGGFDSWSIIDCYVFLNNNLFMMYYTGMDFNMSRTAIGYAFSGDGGTWIRSPNNPVLKASAASSEWDSGFVRSPHVILTRDQYVMYYLGGKGNDMNGGLTSIGYATSPNGLAFKRAVDNPVIEPRVGGQTDDYRGIRSLIVFEDMDGPFTILYTGQGMDWANRIFSARSGHVGEGYYVSRSFALDRRPDSFAGVKVDVDIPEKTSVEVSLRTSSDGNSWTQWHEIWPTGDGEDVPTEPLFQLRVDLATEFGEDSPLVRNVVLDYVSRVRFSTITVFPVPIVPETIMNIDHVLTGAGADDVTTDVYLETMGWSELAIYGEHGRYGSGPDFGYRFNFTSSPAKVHSLVNTSFALGYISLPSDVTIDVGDDGTEDYIHEVPEFEGLHELDVTTATSTWMDSKGYQKDELTITYRVHTATPGVLTLRGVVFIVDTTPKVIGVSPEDPEVQIEEGDTQGFSLTVDELDGDELSYTWYIDTAAVANTPSYTFTAEEDGDTDDPAPVAIKVVVSDGTHNAPMVQWTVYVKDTTEVPNVAPIIDSSIPDTTKVSMDENTTQEFWVHITDPDVGPQGLVYTWYVNGDQVSEGVSDDHYEFTADYDAAGTYDILVEATDGEASVDQSWELTVTNVKKPGPNGNGNGDGDGTDDPDVNWLPFLFILIIIGVIAVGGVMYMRGQQAKMGGEAAPPEGDEPITADVPVEPEVTAETASAPQPAPPVEEPSFTETASLGKDVASGPSASTAAKAVTAPIGVLPLADMDK
ncbi:MAG: hypothetical protein KAQ96_03235, partial [Thermoplasmata archaeon]|nr:hypothetical protein [Thermoplasmata archaeon]